MSSQTSLRRSLISDKAFTFFKKGAATLISDRA